MAEESEEQEEEEGEEEGMVEQGEEVEARNPRGESRSGLQEDQILLTTREPSSSCRNLSPNFLVNMKADSLVSCQREKKIRIKSQDFYDVVIFVCNHHSDLEVLKSQLISVTN